MAAIRVRWRLTRSEVAARWAVFCLLTVCVLAAYAALILAMTTLNIGGLPNYYRQFHAVDGLVDTLTLSMPLTARYELLTEQPILEFGYRHPTLDSLEGVYTLSVHAAVNLVFMSVLIATYCLLLSRALGSRGLTSETLAGFFFGGGGSAMSVLTASAATVACCGGTGVSVALSLLGVGTWAGLFLAEHDRAFGALGIGLMLLNLWVTVGWIAPCRRAPTSAVSHAQTSF